MKLDDHSTQYKISIGEFMLTQRRIYLDTKYWIILRDAALGSASTKQAEIYKKLRRLVQKKTIICPLSPDAFEELIKQGDEKKRLETARVMDELSQQITFISPLNIVGQEILCFIRNCQRMAEGKPLFNAAKYVWTKVPFLFGEVFPYYEALTPSLNEEIGIKFYDHLSKYSLVEMLQFLKDIPARNRSSLIFSMNTGKDQNQQWNNFHDVFMAEVGGILDIIRGDIKEVLRYLKYEDTGQLSSSEEMEGSCQLMRNAIYNAFSQRKITRELPSLHVRACIYAFIRYNKRQRFKENDISDIAHASWALPYCDDFFTERRLASWISGPLIKLHRCYETSVLHNEDAILRHLDEIDG